MAFGPKGCDLHHQLAEYHRLADGKAVIDYGFHGVAQHVDRGILDELEAMAEDGVPSIKVYLTYDFRLNDAEAFQILKRMKELGGVTAFHCENHDIVEYCRRTCVETGRTDPIYHAKSRPNLAESEAVARVLSLARLAGGGAGRQTERPEEHFCGDLPPVSDTDGGEISGSGRP